MHFEVMTLVMLGLVIALKYGAVSRIVKLNQKFRDAENMSTRHESFLERKRGERKLAEREETNLTGQQVGLESEMKRLDEEWAELKKANIEAWKELLQGNTGSEDELLKSTGLSDEEDGEISKN